MSGFVLTSVEPCLVFRHFWFGKTSFTHGDDAKLRGSAEKTTINQCRLFCLHVPLAVFVYCNKWHDTTKNAQLLDLYSFCDISTTIFVWYARFAIKLVCHTL